MLRATEHEAASSCITITETPVLNTFVWVARVNAQGLRMPHFCTVNEPQVCTAWADAAVIRSSVLTDLHAGCIHPRRRRAPPRASRYLQRTQRRLVASDLPLGSWHPGKGGERGRERP